MVEMAQPYLSKDQRKVMRHAMGAFRTATFAIWLRLPDGECPANKLSYDEQTRTVDWKDLSESH